MTIFSVLLFLFLFTTAFFSFLVAFYQAWKNGWAARPTVPPRAQSHVPRHSPDDR